MEEKQQEQLPDCLGRIQEATRALESMMAREEAGAVISYLKSVLYQPSYPAPHISGQPHKGFDTSEKETAFIEGQRTLARTLLDMSKIPLT